MRQGSSPRLARRRRRVAAVAAAFFASGASALAFEALWFHRAGLAFGNGVWASSLVLAAFMGGMALGNAIGARYGDRIPNPLGAYAALEIGVGVVGLLLVAALPAVGSVLAPMAALLRDHPGLHDAFRLSTAFVLLLVPSTAIGMTLPLIVRAGRVHDRNFGRVLGLLYGVNTLGGVVGVVVVEGWWLPALGTWGAAWAAAALNGFAAGVAVIVARALGDAPATAAGGDTRPRRPGPAGRPTGPSAAVPTQSERATVRASRLSQSPLPWLFVAFQSGFVVLALEVVWLRFLSLLLNDTPLAFSMLLALVLAGLAVGGLIAAGGAAWSARADRAAPLLAFAVGVLGLLGYRWYPEFLSGPLPARQGPATILAIAAPLVLPACIASGVLFPLLGTGLRARARTDAATVGLLALLNTVGAALGSLAAGFWLLPRFGMEGALFGLFAFCGVGGTILSLAAEPVPWRRYLSPVAFAGVLILFPTGMMDAEYIRISAQRWKRPDDEIVRVREGLTATLIHVVHKHDGEVLFDHIATNAYSMTTNGFMARRYMKLFVYLPVAVHPKIARALVVGFGVGNTAKALVDTQEVERIDVVDISPDMLEESRHLARPLEPHPLDDARTNVHIEDGRYFLQVTDAQYDLITGEPPPPIIAGVANLYTQEYFELTRRRLAPGGMVTYWLPLSNITAKTARSIVRAFCNVFEDCSLWHGADLDLMLLGTRDAPGGVTAARFEQQWRSPAVRHELVQLGLEVPGQLGALFIGDAAYLAVLTDSVEPLTDDWPRRLEGAASRLAGERLLARLQEPSECRQRFSRSPLIGRLLPEAARESAEQWFDTQRFINDFLSPQPTVAREARTLHMVLRANTLELPVLLLLGSSPDYQAVLSRLEPLRRRTPPWRRHALAALLADRDLAGALEVVGSLRSDELLIPDLPKYLAFAVERTRVDAP